MASENRGGKLEAEKHGSRNRRKEVSRLFSRLRSVFKNSHHMTNRPKINPGWKEELTLEV